LDHPVVAELLREIRDELRRNNNGGGGTAGGEAAAPSPYGDSEVPFVAGKPVA
jgi:xanthine dehydrogenase iron-sulfur cluster and FAD-binding subunit A